MGNWLIWGVEDRAYHWLGFLLANDRHHAKDLAKLNWPNYKSFLIEKRKVA